jgi:hypothetical protein
MSKGYWRKLYRPPSWRPRGGSATPCPAWGGRTTSIRPPYDQKKKKLKRFGPWGWPNHPCGPWAKTLEFSFLFYFLFLFFCHKVAEPPSWVTGVVRPSLRAKTINFFIFYYFFFLLWGGPTPHDYGQYLTLKLNYL